MLPLSVLSVESLAGIIPTRRLSHILPVAVRVLQQPFFFFSFKLPNNVSIPNEELVSGVPSCPFMSGKVTFIPEKTCSTVRRAERSIHHSFLGTKLQSRSGVKHRQQVWLGANPPVRANMNHNRDTTFT